MERIRYSVVDRYILLNMWEESALLPDGDMAASLAATLGSFPDFKIVCDTRDVSETTNDIHDLIDFLEPRKGPGFLDSRISEILLGFQAANSRVA